MRGEIAEGESAQAGHLHPTVPATENDRRRINGLSTIVSADGILTPSSGFVGVGVNMLCVGNAPANMLCAVDST